MRMFVLISRFQKPFEEVNRSFALHSAWVQRNYESGRFLVSGRREPTIGGIIVARASSEQELREILTTDPYQQRGLAEYESLLSRLPSFPNVVAHLTPLLPGHCTTCHLCRRLMVHMYTNETIGLSGEG